MLPLFFHPRCGQVTAPVALHVPYLINGTGTDLWSTTVGSVMANSFAVAGSTGATLTPVAWPPGSSWTEVRASPPP